jgi:hypothetical protein
MTMLVAVTLIALATPLMLSCSFGKIVASCLNAGVIPCSKVAATDVLSLSNSGLIVDAAFLIPSRPRATVPPAAATSPSTPGSVPMMVEMPPQAAVIAAPAKARPVPTAEA